MNIFNAIKEKATIDDFTHWICYLVTTGQMCLTYPIIPEKWMQEDEDYQLLFKNLKMHLLAEYISDNKCSD